MSSHISIGLGVASFGLIWHYIGSYFVAYVPQDMAAIFQVNSQANLMSFLNMVFLGIGGSFVYRNVLMGRIGAIGL